MSSLEKGAKREEDVDSEITGVIKERSKDLLAELGK